MSPAEVLHVTLADTMPDGTLRCREARSEKLLGRYGNCATRCRLHLGHDGPHELVETFGASWARDVPMPDPGVPQR